MQVLVALINLLEICYRNIVNHSDCSALTLTTRASSPCLVSHCSVNTDEAYSHYNGAPNPQFDIGMCRVQV